MLVNGGADAVILGETWIDYRQIAAAGTGFDPNREREARYW